LREPNIGYGVCDDALAGPRFPMARDDALNLLVNAKGALAHDPGHR
jgi:hypothetical protein